MEHRTLSGTCEPADADDVYVLTPAGRAAADDPAWKDGGPVERFPGPEDDPSGSYA